MSSPTMARRAYLGSMAAVPKEPQSNWPTTAPSIGGLRRRLQPIPIPRSTEPCGSVKHSRIRDVNLDCFPAEQSKGIQYAGLRNQQHDHGPARVNGRGRFSPAQVLPPPSMPPPSIRTRPPVWTPPIRARAPPMPIPAPSVVARPPVRIRTSPIGARAPPTSVWPAYPPHILYAIGDLVRG